MSMTALGLTKIYRSTSRSDGQYVSGQQVSIHNTVGCEGSQTLRWAVPLFDQFIPSVTAISR
jgi:hypothetical protein